MPFGLIRYHESKQSHFITVSCFHRKSHFSEPAIRDIFLTSLEQTRLTYALRVYGYVVMLEHVHLIVSEPDRGARSNAMQALKVSVAKHARTRTPGVLKVEPFWQTRCYDHNIRTYEKFIEKLKYIHRNPVKRELVQRPEDWPWSSFRHYASGDPASSKSSLTGQPDTARPCSTHPSAKHHGARVGHHRVVIR